MEAIGNSGPELDDEEPATDGRLAAQDGVAATDSTPAATSNSWQCIMWKSAAVSDVRDTSVPAKKASAIKETEVGSESTSMSRIDSIPFATNNGSKDASCAQASLNRGVGLVTYAI